MQPKSSNVSVEQVIEDLWNDLWGVNLEDNNHSCQLLCQRDRK